MKRKIDQGGDKPVGSENVRVGDVIADLISVMILCNMVFVNPVVLRRSRDVVEYDCCGDYQRILCNTTEWRCIRAQCRFLSPFGDMDQCFLSNTHLKNNLFLQSVNLRFDQCAAPAPAVGGVEKSLKGFSLMNVSLLRNTRQAKEKKANNATPV